MPGLSFYVCHVYLTLSWLMMPNSIMRFSSIMMSLPAMSIGDRFCVNRKDWIGGGGWVHPQGKRSMVAFRLSCRNFWLALGGYSNLIPRPSPTLLQ